MDSEKIKQAAVMFLEAIGEDPGRPGLADTPDRIARMCEEIFSGMEADPRENLKRVFPMEEPGIVMEKGIRFYSVCEHHLLPFFGTVSIAYSYKDRVVGLSKLARTVDVYAKRPQIQERMTRQIGEAIMNELSCEGVMVIVRAEHLCMSMRGVKNPGVETMTIYTAGCFDTDEELRRSTMENLKG